MWGENDIRKALKCGYVGKSGLSLLLYALGAMRHGRVQ